MNKDILSVISERDSALVRHTMKKATAYVVMRGDGSRSGRRLYTSARARKVASRARRCGMDVYVTVFGTVNVTKEQHAAMAGR